MDNILEFHKQIETHFKEEISQLEGLTTREQQVCDYLSQPWLSERVRSHLIDDLDEIRTTIKNINFIRFYFVEIRSILKEYVQLMQMPTVNTFFQKEDGGTKQQHHARKTYVVKNFWEIFNCYKKYYYNVKVVDQQKDDPNTCQYCGSTLGYFFDETVNICYTCKSEKVYFIQSSNTDTTRVNPKYIYDRNQHFRDCMIRFQGKQKNTIPPTILENISNHLSDYRLTTISLSHVCMIMKNLGYSKYYDDYVLIHHLITGQPPCDISFIEEQLLQEFDIINMELKNFKELNKKNFNTQYILFLLLKHHNINVHADHFMLIKSNERKLLTDKICKTIFKSLGWKFNSIL